MNPGVRICWPGLLSLSSSPPPPTQNVWRTNCRGDEIETLPGYPGAKRLRAPEPIRACGRQIVTEDRNPGERCRLRGSHGSVDQRLLPMEMLLEAAPAPGGGGETAPPQPGHLRPGTAARLALPGLPEQMGIQGKSEARSDAELMAMGPAGQGREGLRVGHSLARGSP
ncbi:unnamed protein product [Pipistrellus nathusii]|uniref:Uncharacterized protein n=1 Tax=Pipistrellus nathusii TaxID=59473 RepID=A0ABP0AKG8_PIPNA